MPSARVSYRSLISHHVPLLASLLLVALALAACGSAAAGTAPADGSGTPTRSEQLAAHSETAEPPDRPAPAPTATAAPRQEPLRTPTPRPLVDPTLSLYAGPVPVSLQITVPSIKVDAPVYGVGLTTGNVMDVPGGEVGDPMYDTVFWYRGSAEPGAMSTATLAGHVTGRVGEPAVFARLESIKVGDVIFVTDTETGRRLTFEVAETELLSMERANDRDVLERVYGVGPVSGVPPQPSPDGLAHLTLITCAGSWVDNGFDHRFVVFAQLVNSGS